MKRNLTKIASFILVIILLFIVLFNYSLFYKPKFLENKSLDISYNLDVYQQLQFLKEELNNGAAHEMQTLFPEGFVFINSLYGLSWCNLIENQEVNSELYKEGIQEISWALNEVLKPEAKSIFDKNLDLKYGAYYRGWSNYLLAKKLLLQPINTRDSSEVYLYTKNCQDIDIALTNSDIPFLESYYHQTWPADGIIAFTSLNYSTKILSKEFKNDQSKWLKSVQTFLDPETNLIPHKVDSQTGAVIEGARGSSQSLILCFLKEIEDDFSFDQFRKYENKFLVSRFFLPAIREYPKGNNAKGDIDSGPIILGIGGAASIVGQRTMGLYNNLSAYEGLRNCIETFGLSMNSDGKKKYLFGQLVMADAFIVWSNSIESDNKIITNENWRTPFQITSFISSLLVLFLLNKSIKNK